MGVQVITDDIAILSRDEPRFASVRHSHAEAQLIYAISGIVSVTTDQGSWVVPPSRAVWVPAGIEHETRSHAAVKFRALSIEAAAARNLPEGCAVVDVTPLLRELILRLAELGQTPMDAEYVRALTHLVLCELGVLPVQPLNLPMPRHERLARLCEELRNQPALEISLEQAAARLGMSRSSFMRLFARETHMSFGRWRQQARLLAALPLLAEGRSVLTVALECGYDSASAFSAMFRRSFGRSPSEYFQSHGSATPDDRHKGLRHRAHRHRPRAS